MSNRRQHGSTKLIVIIKGILTKTASENLKSMGASENFIRKATQGMATSRIQNLITNKTLKDAAIEKLEISQLVARWKLKKGG